ncbi:MAG: NRDE family protein [Burkholderiales bacterium]
MCLIVFAWGVVPGTSLVLACNRDEFFERPAAPAAWWEDHPQVYAGRDLQGGGTWLGVTREGRFAALTNIRAPAEHKADAHSRGMLVADYLCGQSTPEAYIAELMQEISADPDRYNGFNLIVGTPDKLIWYNNRDRNDARNGQLLAPGIYGLSNDRLDSPWPKVVRTKAQFASLLCQCAPQDAYFEMLTDTTRASDCRLPQTGVGIEWERVLSAVCIESPTYGTRVSSVVQVYPDRAPVLLERPIHQGAGSRLIQV